MPCLLAGAQGAQAVACAAAYGAASGTSSKAARRRSGPSLAPSPVSAHALPLPAPLRAQTRYVASIRGATRAAAASTPIAVHTCAKKA